MDAILTSLEADDLIREISLPSMVLFDSHKLDRDLAKALRLLSIMACTSARGTRSLSTTANLLDSVSIFLLKYSLTLDLSMK